MRKLSGCSSVLKNFLIWFFKILTSYIPLEKLLCLKLQLVIAANEPLLKILHTGYIYILHIKMCKPCDVLIIVLVATTLWRYSKKDTDDLYFHWVLILSRESYTE